jgi:hypothetical protein
VSRASKGKAAIERNAAMLFQNKMPGCLICQKGTANHPLTRWICTGTGAPPPNHRRQKIPERMSPLPGTPPASTGSTSRAQCQNLVNLPDGYAYSHTSYPCAESTTLDTSAQDSMHNTDFYPDMLPDEGASTG